MYTYVATNYKLAKSKQPDVILEVMFQRLVCNDDVLETTNRLQNI